MPSRAKAAELKRLHAAFAREADRFPDATLSVMYLTQASTPQRALRRPNHAIYLWQYYGAIETPEEGRRAIADLIAMDDRLGAIRGSQFSCVAVIEGEATPLFVRMANRAGSLFTEREAARILERARRDFETNAPRGKPVFSRNHNALSVWLCHVLHHLGHTHSGYLPDTTLALDPFAASLSALDALTATRARSPQNAAAQPLSSRRFKVALSFPGERRPYVKEVANGLSQALGRDNVFYDEYYEPDLARPNLDVLLQTIYHDHSDLVVVFLCAEYESKEWCGLEWRAIRDLIKKRKADSVMFCRFDGATVSGVYSIDGYLDLSTRSPDDTVVAITARVG